MNSVIRFCYPNVSEDLQFAGCGRYLTTAVDDPRLSGGYEFPDPNSASFTDIMDVLDDIAPEAFHADLEVYECKDNPAIPYLGESKGLAYLLAFISRTWKTVWDTAGTPLDIWCTGTIVRSDDHQVKGKLKKVYDNLFERKIEAFLDRSSDRIFIVPFGNLSPYQAKYKPMCAAHGVTILSLDDFAKNPMQILEQRMIVMVRDKELQRLLNVVFVLPPNPYRGLFAFQEQDAKLFFGRDIYIQQVVSAVQHEPVVAVIGASGSGKTSLVYAGFIPYLRQHGIASRPGKTWNIIAFRPGESPCQAFVSALTALLPDDVAEFQQCLSADGSMSEIFQVFRQRHPQTPFLIFIDQFEELYTLCRDEYERRRFLDTFLKMPVTSGHTGHLVRVVFTMRADFLGRGLAYRPFADVLQTANIMLGPMNREELRAVIEQPAATYQIGIEDGLTDRILDAVGNEPGYLPLLEFALTEMWDKQQHSMLTNATYQAIGGVEQALAYYAESFYTNLSAEEQGQVQRIFTQVVHPGEGTEDTRRVATRAEIGEENWELVRKLADARLVVTGSVSVSLTDQGQTEPRAAAQVETVEVVHEALISRWQRLQEWVHADREFRMWQERLRSTIRQWNMSRHDAGALLRGAPLAEAENWLQHRVGDLTEEERGLIAASTEVRGRELAEHEAQRQRELDTAKRAKEEATKREQIQRKSAQWARMFSAVILIITFIAMVFLMQTIRKSRELERRTIESLGVSATALFLSNDGLDAMWAIVKAGDMLRRTTVPDWLHDRIIENMRRIINGVYEKNRLEAYTVPASTVTFSPDSRFIASGGKDGTVIVWDITKGRVIRMSGHTNWVLSVAVSPDSSLLASGGFDQTIAIWKVSTGEKIRTLRGHTGLVYQVAFHPEGKMLASASADQTIKLWNVADGTEITTLSGYGDRVACLAFSPDGKLLASGYDEQTINLWNIPDRSLIRSFQAHDGIVYGVAFSPDGKILASGSADKTVKLWDVADGQELRVLPGHADFVSSVQFSPDGRLIASGSGDETIKLWSWKQESVVTNFFPVHIPGLDTNRDGKDEKNVVYALSFSPDSRLLASASWDGTIRVWQTANKEPIETTSLDELLAQGCEWLHDYLQTHPDINQADRTVCEPIQR